MPATHPGYPGATEALEALRPTLLALPGDAARPFRASVSNAVAQTLRLVRAFNEDRAAFVAAFKKDAFDPDTYTDLTPRALALWAADIELSLALDPEDALAKTAASATPLRNKLLRAADYLFGDDPELGVQVARIRSGSGYEDLAGDLATLAALFEARWSFARDRCDVDEVDLDQARAASLAILDALTPDADATSRVELARELRNRAGNHLADAIDEIRAAAAWVHRRQPARLDDYPSLYMAARPRSRRESTQDAPPATTPDVEPVPTSPDAIL